jgi:alpha-tubulin suppressor-like RCC1 family protein
MGPAEIALAEALRMPEKPRPTVGARHVLFVKPDGTLWAWGANEKGQLGDGSTIGSSFPLQVLSGSAKNMYWVAAAAGESHSAALRSDGTVWTWGEDALGAMGGAGSSVSPVMVPGLPPIKAITASSYGSFALDESGNVWSWGDRRVLGRAGDTTPARIDGLTGVKAISAGNYNVFALMGDATVMAWGDNEYGRVGVYRGYDETSWRALIGWKATPTWASQ